jgi:hypothetical protein
MPWLPTALACPWEHERPTRSAAARMAALSGEDEPNVLTHSGHYGTVPLWFCMVGEKEGEGASGVKNVCEAIQRMTAQIPDHFRRDNPRGITAPNPDAPRDTIAHITKHRGLKTPYTSVSQDANAIRHFHGELYRTDPNKLLHDGHSFTTHVELMDALHHRLHASRREERVLATRAIQLAGRAKEALIDWQFALQNVPQQDRIRRCYDAIQQYFHRL